MPYIRNYTQVLEAAGIPYRKLIWDRFGTEATHELIFRRGPARHRRGIIDYYLFGNFVKNVLESNSYGKVICFGLQAAHFLKPILQKKYVGQFVIDVRDHNLVARFADFSSLVNAAAFTAISSDGYLKWLPRSGKYVTCHNVLMDDGKELADVVRFHSDHIDVASIGAFRDFGINKEFAIKLRAGSKIRLQFHGHGDMCERLRNFLVVRDVNAEFSGRYRKEEEPKLYASADLVNVLRYADGINNITALPNRLYAGPKFGRPLLALRGTYLAAVIEREGLGLVLDSLDGVEGKIGRYAESFRRDEFDLLRKKFLTKVNAENRSFELELMHWLMRRGNP